MDDERAGMAAGADPRDVLLTRLAAGEGPHAGTARLSLAGLDLGRAALAARLDPDAPPPAWWDAQGGLGLAGADLAGAALEKADLSGANLSGANLSGARGRATRLAEARAEDTDFTEADLSGADFSDLVGGQARFTDAMLEDARFDRAAMRFARLDRALLDGARFEGADLWGADFKGADADDCVFRGARLDEADLSDVNLTHADFTGASLKKTKLVGSRLRGADFSGAKLDGADLSRADLAEANLVRLDLMSCCLVHARFAGAWLDGTRLSVTQLGGMVGEEADGAYEAARLSYLVLEQNMKGLGRHEEASWAYKRGRRVGRYHAGVQAKAAYAARDPHATLRHGYRWTADRFAEWLCDYGESLSRIARALSLAIVLFAAGYGLTGGLILEGPEHAPTYNPIDLMTYSALNMLTANPPEIGMKPTGRVTNLLVGVEGAVGIILLGLFGFVLGNRLRQ